MSETPTERNRRIYLDATAAGEPVFVIRAKDRHAPSAILAYAVIASDSGDAFCDALDELVAEVEAWQAANPEQVKAPDLRTEVQA